MDILTLIMLAFSMLGALDRIIGGKLGLSKEFEKGFHLLGTMVLAMVGIIVISPLVAELLAPVFDALYDTFGIDPSIIPALIFANDMGGASLAAEVTKDPLVGGFMGLVTSSMMGALVSFVIPFALGTVKKENHRELLLGLLCGVTTIPVGCFIAGLAAKLPLGTLILNLMPLILFSAVVALGLAFVPTVCIKIFGLLGIMMKILITAGLALSVFRYLTGIELVEGLGTLEDSAAICLNISVILSGAFVMMSIVTRVFKKPFSAMGRMLGISADDTSSLVSTLITSVAAFEAMNNMSKRGIILNAAFAVSAAFVFGDHLAFTLAFDSSYIFPVILGKITAGISALAVAVILCAKDKSGNYAADTSEKL